MVGLDARSKKRVAYDQGEDSAGLEKRGGEGGLRRIEILISMPRTCDNKSEDRERIPPVCVNFVDLMMLDIY
jgi:hypothetical protein